MIGEDKRREEMMKGVDTFCQSCTIKADNITSDTTSGYSTLCTVTFQKISRLHSSTQHCTVLDCTSPHRSLGLISGKIRDYKNILSSSLFAFNSSTLLFSHPLTSSHETCPSPALSTMRIISSTSSSVTYMQRNKNVRGMSRMEVNWIELNWVELNWMAWNHTVEHERMG